MSSKMTPRTDAIVGFVDRCERFTDMEVVTSAALLSIAHEEADELRELAEALERELLERKEEVGRILDYWFKGADPKETEYAVMYHSDASFNCQEIGYGDSQ